MVVCEKLKAKIPESTCIARQKILSKGQKPISTYSKTKYSDCVACLDCEIGLGLYKKYINGDIIMNEKTCTKCGKKKALNLFYKQASSKDGYAPHCKKCHNLYTAAKKFDAKKTADSNHIKKSERPKTIRCDKCQKEYPMTGEWLVPDPNSETGFEPVCWACQVQLEQKPADKEMVGKKIFIDFTDHPEVWGKVEAWARSWARTPQKQILYHLGASRLKNGKVA